jgi:hypothetical protein
MLKPFLFVAAPFVAGLFAACLVAAPPAAFAQVVDPIGHTGAVISFTEDSVTMKESDGKVVTVALTQGWTVVTARKSSADAIKPGDFVATANTNMDADSGKSTEVRIFEPGYEPEHGTHPIGRPNTSMTHGKVLASMKMAEGQMLDVTYPGGVRHLIVPPDVTVTGFDVHDRTWVKAGVTVTAVTRQDPDKVWRAGRLQIVQK